MYNKFLNLDMRCLNDYSTGDLPKGSSWYWNCKKTFAAQLVNAFGSIATIVLVIVVMSLINLKLTISITFVL